MILLCLALPSGLEPKQAVPKTAVLPITPRENWLAWTLAGYRRNPIDRQPLTGEHMLPHYRPCSLAALLYFV